MGLSERKVKRQLVGSAVSSNAAWTANGALPGQRMLASMGWSQGQGLGLTQQGSAAPISVAFKLDNKGLGVTRAEKEARSSANTASDWLGGGSDYEALLQRLNAANSSTPASPRADTAAIIVESDTHGQKETKKKKRKVSQADDDDTDDSQKRKKSKKDNKRKHNNNNNSDSSSPEPAPVLTTVAVTTLTKPVAPHRLAHRAKFLRAKGLLGPDSRASPNPSGSSTPVPQSPAPASLSPPPAALEDDRDAAESTSKKPKETRTKKGKLKPQLDDDDDDDGGDDAKGKAAIVTVEATVVTQIAADKLTDKARRKAEKAAAKEAKKAAKKAAKLTGPAHTVKLPEVESESSSPSPLSPPSASTPAKESPKAAITDPFDAPLEPPPSQLSVQAYLANKLIRRKAEVARAKREAEQALWARAAGATAASS